MNFFEWEITKYERRIERIKNNPDPTKLQCNQLLYEMWLDFRKQQLKEWAEGRPFAYESGGLGVQRVLQALGFRTIHLPTTADRAGDRAAQYFDACRRPGYPDTICDRIQVYMGMALSRDIPPPRFVAIGFGECLPCTYGSRWLMEVFKVPGFTVDMDCYIQDQEDNEECLKHLTHQLEEMISLAEKEVPGIKFDEAKLAELQERERTTQLIRDEIREIKRAVPCPVSGKDSLRMPPIDLIHDPRYLEYMNMFRDEVREKAARGVGALAEEKLRFAWLVSAPFYTDPFSYLEKRGVAVPIYDAGADAPRAMIGDEELYGRKLSPLEAEAAEMIVPHASGRRGPSENKVHQTVNIVRDMNLDGVVFFMLWGCTSELGHAKLVADRVEEETGVPTLMIEGWCLDSEKYDKDQFENQLGSFVDLCLVKKGLA